LSIRRRRRCSPNRGKPASGHQIHVRGARFVKRDCKWRQWSNIGMILAGVGLICDKNSVFSVGNFFSRSGNRPVCRGKGLLCGAEASRNTGDRLSCRRQTVLSARTVCCADRNDFGCEGIAVRTGRIVFSVENRFCVGGVADRRYSKWTVSPKHDDGRTKADAVCSAVDFQVQLDGSRTQ
jgi:hypothetical protein